MKNILLIFLCFASYVALAQGPVVNPITGVANFSGTGGFVVITSTNSVLLTSAVPGQLTNEQGGASPSGHEQYASPSTLYFRQVTSGSNAGTTAEIQTDWTFPSASNVQNISLLVSSFPYGNVSAAGATSIGAQATSVYTGSGTLGNLYLYNTHGGNESSSFTAGGGVVNIFTSVNVNTPISGTSSTIGTAYGLLINPQATTGVGTAYAIQQTGTADLVNLAGLVTISNPNGITLSATNSSAEFAGGQMWIRGTGGGNWLEFTGSGDNFYLANAPRGSAPDGNIYLNAFNGSSFIGLIQYTKTGNVNLLQTGATLSMKGGANAASGTFVMSSGTGTVTSTAISGSTGVSCCILTASGSAFIDPAKFVYSGSAGFSGAVTDNSTYLWWLVGANR